MANTLWSLILFALCATGKAAPFYDDEKVYFWRRYTGAIPPDAVMGGRNPIDQPTYIGQVYFEGALIPAEIRQNQSSVYFVWNGAKFLTENIKILCARHPEQLEWIRVNDKNYKYLWPKHIVLGGFHVLENRPFLIGRILHQNKALIVGEVLVNDKEIRIYYTLDGTAFDVGNSDIELLSYNPEISIDRPSDAATAVIKSAPDNQSSRSHNVCLDKIFNLNFN